MNVNSRLGMRHFGNDTRNERNIQFIKFMRYTIVGNGPDGRIAGDNLADTGSSRITVVSSLNIRSQHPPQFGQSLNELHRLFLGSLPLRMTPALSFQVLTAKKQARLNLLDQQMQKPLYGDTR